MHFPTTIIFQYDTFRNNLTSVTQYFTILYEEHKELIEKLDLKNYIQVDELATVLVLELNVKIYDISIETIIQGILKNLFSKSSIQNNLITTNNKMIGKTYVIKEISLKDLICNFYQFIKGRGHFARDMKTVTKQWEIALDKNYLAFFEEGLQDEDIIQLQNNRIRNNNDELDLYRHFSVEQSIYNSLYFLEKQNSDNFYYIYYRIKNTNRFYKFVMSKGKDYKEFQSIQKSYDYIRINFDEALDRCQLFYELEFEILETITKEQIEAIISNFVLINGGKKKIKQYIQYLDLEALKNYDWNIQLDIATLNANNTDLSCVAKCSEFCPFYENCNPIQDNMIETIKNRKPIEAKENTINYVELEKAREELKRFIREAFWF
ncbi:MAG: hypothetical protein J6A89_04375 [Clostridia bacterium]|nr:hypothetical protein [Clostridia bacterium]